MFRVTSLVRGRSPATISQGEGEGGSRERERERGGGSEQGGKLWENEGGSKGRNYGRMREGARGEIMGE